jgi:hypothetical protein
MHVMQQHYLNAVLPRIVANQTIEFLTTETEAFYPVTGAGKSFLFGTYSVCEMPLEVRHRLEAAYPHFDYLFFSYYTAFDGVDNIAYFNDLAEKLTTQFKIHHFYDEPRRGWFLLAEKKAPT